MRNVDREKKQCGFVFQALPFYSNIMKWRRIALNFESSVLNSRVLFRMLVSNFVPLLSIPNLRVQFSTFTFFPNPRV